MLNSQFEVAVVGLGAVGSATLMHLAQAGVSAIGIDQFSPPHNFGSSHGETRITRESIGEGAAYIPLVRRSHELWRSIGAEVGAEIFTATGGLILDGGKGSSNHGIEGFAKNTIALAKQFNIPHEVLNAKDARARFPEFYIEESDLVYFEPGAGFIRPELAIHSQLKLAEQSGATLCQNERVKEIATSAQGTVQIRTESRMIEAGRCLLSVGSWMKNFMPENLKPSFKIYRQVLHWLPIAKGSYSIGSGSPIFIWCYGPSDEDQIYGFPSLDGETIKVASESYSESETPEVIDRNVSLSEQKGFLRDKIANRMGDITGNPVKSVTCQYTVTPQSKFIIDKHPQMPQVLIASCCSGHGFKHSAALGESIAATLQDRKPLVDLSSFRGGW